MTDNDTSPELVASEPLGGHPELGFTEADIAQRLLDARLQTFLRPPGTRVRDAPDELERLLARTAEVYAKAITDSTRAAYVRRWRTFQRWCDEHQVSALPARPETLMLCLSEAADRSDGAALSTLRGWVAAVNRVHAEAGLPAPGADPIMATYLKGLSRMLPSRARPEPISALRIADLRRVCRTIDATAIDPTELRDRALLALHAAGIRYGEMSRLEWSHVKINPRSLRVYVTPIPGHIKEHTVTVRAVDDERACPVLAVREWARMSGQDGQVFRLIESGALTDHSLRPQGIRRVRETRLQALGHGGGPASVPEAMSLLGQRSTLALRDKAMLLIGFAGAFRRNEVVGLRWSDIRESDSGLVLHLRRSKTDPVGRGRDVGIPYGKSALTCPVNALGDWKLRVVEQLGEARPEDAVFTHVGHSGRITTEPLTPEALTLLVKRRAEAAGIDGHWGGRSLRAGFISTAADLEIPLEAIARQSRHANLNSLVLYVRRSDPFRNNPAGKVGL
jgi:integrase